MTEAAARARVESWLAPISDATPAGEDPRYDPLHEEIRNEAAKIDSPLTGTTDWAKVVKDSDKLISTKAKDLLIESYAAFGLFQTEGLIGLAAGFFLLAESMDKFWEDMHPPARRIRARVNAIGWLTDKLDATLGEVQVGANDHDAVDALEASLKRMRAVIYERFEDQAPSIRPVEDTVARLKMSLPERVGGDAPASDTEPPPPGDAPPGAAPPGATPAEAAPAAAPAEAAPAEAAPAAEAPAAPVAVDYEAQLVESAKAWTEPCPGAEPAGMDAKYEPEHEELRNDITALDTPLGAQLDWNRVVPRAGGILKDKSKDLLIAAYLAYALWETKGVEGLATGLEVIRAICERYWEECQPPARRIRGRANALSWLLDRIEGPLPDVKLTADDKPKVELLEVAVKRFAETVRDKFEDAAPSIRPLQDNVQRLKMSVPEKAAPPPPPKPAAAPAAAPAPRPAAAAPSSSGGASVPSAQIETGSLADAKEIAKFTRDVSKVLTDAAKSIREASPEDATSYHLLRLGTAVKQTRIKAEGNKTFVPAPQAAAMTDLENALSKGDWEGLLRRAEGAMIGKPMWLDLNRYAAVALSNLGDKYAEAHDAVLAGTAFYVRRFPEFLEYTFDSGLPFTSALTREWISQAVMPSGGGGGDGGEGADVIAEARSLAGGGKVDEALDALAGLANGGRSGRARFKAKLAMAQAIASKSPDAAEGIFEGLAQQLERSGLEEWDPEVATECHRAHLACLKQMKSEEAKVRAAQVFRRLCRVDPVGAAKAGGPT
ncbi:MAG: type VI secretion system protein TssA [Sandaracinaceae bacterium]|nr:type VI secretion system protein TssA [Sandaracinaceae bacterium]